MMTNSQPLTPEEILREHHLPEIVPVVHPDNIAEATARLDAHYRTLYDAKFEATIGVNENDTREDGEIMRDPVMRNRQRDQARKRWYGGRDDT